VDKQDTIQLLNFLNAQQVNHGNKWITCCCPLSPWTHDSGKDSNPSFAVKVEPGGESIYNCYTCGHGDLMDLVHRMSELGAQAPKYNLKSAAQLIAQEMEGGVSLNIAEWNTQPEEEVLNPWPETFTSQYPSALDVPIARKYLYLRGVTSSVIESLDIRFDLPRMAVVFPIRDFEGVLMGARGRYIKPKPGAPRYHAYKMGNDYENKSVWYGEEHIDLDNRVVMVESVFDYARAIQITENVIAPLTTGFNKAKAKRLSGVWMITTLFDVGVGGDKAREKVDKYWPDAVITHLKPPAHEAGLDCKPADDPGNMTDQQLRNVFAPGDLEYFS
jgi:hypothetical protein